MKNFEDLKLPTDIKYTEDHEWAMQVGDVVRIGVSDYAQDQLGDIVFVEMPEVGDSFDKGEEFGTLESVKAVSELYLPVAGEITAVNENLVDAPELINEDPYENWIVEVKLEDSNALEGLLSHGAYSEIVKG
ncbi:MAG: glycine cleavage system protein GcvH [Desulfotalea sp.]